MMYQRAAGAIPRDMLRERFMPRRTKVALALGLCPDCWNELEVIDTWERACPDQVCGYTFDYYHWPLMTAPLPPDQDE